MHFKDHSTLIGKHAFLSPSNYHWLRYNDDKLLNVYSNFRAAERGTKLHEFAKDAISLGIRLPNTKSTFNKYVNDAIGYHMTPEQPLYFSQNCFGVTDAIAFKSNKILRIHDLKTGQTPPSMDQLIIYSALFCLEYGENPEDFETELRIYTPNEILVNKPIPEDIRWVMDKIMAFDELLDKSKEG